MLFDNANSSGIILFLVSIFASKHLRLCNSWVLNKPKALLTSRQATSESTATIPKTAIVVDLTLPYSDGELLQRLKNDIILSKVIEGGNKRYYMRIVANAQAPPSAIVTYISELYSTTWNEAVNKKIYGLDCIITCDKLQEKVQADLTKIPYTIEKVYTNPQVIPENKLNAKEVIDTDSFVKNLTAGYAISTLHFLDSHPTATYTSLPQYEYVAVGGSFDQLHNGHRKLLSIASTVCTQRLTIGITGASMLTAKTFAEYIDPYPVRAEEVEKYVVEINPSIGYNIVSIEDIYGPTITDPSLQAIVVSSETITGAFQINKVRAQQGMSPLVVLVIHRSDSAILSSTFLRMQKAASMTTRTTSA